MGKKWKEKRLRLRTPNWSGPSEISHRAWFSPEEYKQLYTATRQRVREPEKKDFNCEAENLHDFVLFAVNTGLRPDEAWRALSLAGCGKRLGSRDIPRLSRL